nr:YdeI/OmpD-associated family protein [Microbacterium thalassium]
MAAALDAAPAARTAWDGFPPSARKLGIGAVDTARRAETRAARIAKIVADAAEGKRP